MVTQTEHIDIDVYGRTFDGIFGKGAQDKNQKQALMKLKAVRDFRSSARKGEFVDNDVYGRGDPRIFGQSQQNQHSDSQPLLSTASSKSSKNFFLIPIRKAKKLLPSKRSQFVRSDPSYQRIETVTSDSDLDENDIDGAPRRVKSKLPSEEQHPYVQPGTVAKAVESLNSDIDHEHKEKQSVLTSPKAKTKRSQPTFRSVSYHSSSEYSNHLSSENATPIAVLDSVRRFHSVHSKSSKRSSGHIVYKEKKDEFLTPTPRSKSDATFSTTHHDVNHVSTSSSSSETKLSPESSQPSGQVGRLAHLFETNKLHSSSSEKSSSPDVESSHDSDPSTNQGTIQPNSSGSGEKNIKHSSTPANYNVQKLFNESTSNETETSSTSHSSAIQGQVLLNDKSFSSESKKEEHVKLPIQKQSSSSKENIVSQDYSAKDIVQVDNADFENSISGSNDQFLDRKSSRDTLEADPGVVPTATNHQLSPSSLKQRSIKSQTTTSSERLEKLRSMFRARRSRESGGSSSTDRARTSRTLLSRSSLRLGGSQSSSRSGSRQLSNSSTRGFFRRGPSQSSRSGSEVNLNSLSERDSSNSQAQITSTETGQEYSSSHIIDSDRSHEAPTSSIVESSTTMEGTFNNSGDNSSRKMTSQSSRLISSRDSDEIMPASDDEIKNIAES